MTVTATELPRDGALEVVTGRVDRAAPAPAVTSATARGGSHSLDLPAGSYVRAVVRDAAGRIVGVGNPLWVADEPPPPVPSARRLLPAAAADVTYPAVRALTVAEATARQPELLALEERASGPAGPGRAAIMARHFGYAGFRAVVAEDAGRLLGFCYGYVSAPGQWWNGEVRRAIGEDRARAVLDGALEIAELHVDPPAQRRGLGRGLLYALADGAGERHAVLTTDATNGRARALYGSAGFTVLHPTLWNRAVAMVAPLPLPLPAPAAARS